MHACECMCVGVCMGLGVPALNMENACCIMQFSIASYENIVLLSFFFANALSFSLRSVMHVLVLN